jgi:hypothetical protein
VLTKTNKSALEWYGYLNFFTWLCHVAGALSVIAGFIGVAVSISHMKPSDVFAGWMMGGVAVSLATVFTGFAILAVRDFIFVIAETCDSIIQANARPEPRETERAHVPENSILAKVR